MIYGAKISGESLRDDPTATWTKTARLKTAQQLADLHLFVKSRNQKTRGGLVTGAVAVVGAGNGGFRGDDLVREQDMDRDVADWIGLTGTAMNSMVLASDLARKKVPHRLLRAATADITLPGMPPLERASPERIQACFRAGELAIIAFGSGKTGQSTDSAVMDHIRDYRDVIGDDEVEAWKATLYGGVYEGDPAVCARRGDPLPHHFDVVTTARIRKEEWTPVDQKCLSLIDETGIPMRLHMLDAAPADIAAGKVGSLIVPDPEFASV
jgi:uridylate kinase